MHTDKEVGGIEPFADRYRSYPREVRLGPIKFNPVVTFIATVCLWGLAVFGMVAPKVAADLLSSWKDWVAINFIWLYIGSQVCSHLRSASGSGRNANVYPECRLATLPDLTNPFALDLM